MKPKSSVVAVVCFLGSFGAHSFALGDVVVGDSNSLVSVLAQSQAGERILLLAGSYELQEGLYVPDGVTLAGEGVMQFDTSGRPTGIEPTGRTVVKSTGSLIGNIVTLGDNAGLQGLVIEDIDGRSGNAVVVSSRSNGDVVATWINQCEIINPNPARASPAGPLGRAVLLITQNFNLDSTPPPHEDSAVSVAMNSSVVRSAQGGSAVMAINFASRSRITALLSGNVLGGNLDVAAGVSRPDSVSDSSVTIVSSNNIYRSETAQPTGLGWNLVAGTDAPIPGLISQPTHGNRIYLESTRDRIETFAVGMDATGGRRYSPFSGEVSMNELDISATDLEILATARDFSLYGDFSFANGMSAGNENSVILVLRGASGSGLRDNRYEHSSSNLGIGNELAFPGNSNAFHQANRDIVPSPPARFFTSGR